MAGGVDARCRRRAPSGPGVREADDPLDARAVVGDVEGRHVAARYRRTRRRGPRTRLAQLGGRRHGRDAGGPAAARRRCRWSAITVLSPTMLASSARTSVARPVLRSMPWSGLPRLLPAQMPSSLALAADELVVGQCTRLCSCECARAPRSAVGDCAAAGARLRRSRRGLGDHSEAGACWPLGLLVPLARLGTTARSERSRARRWRMTGRRLRINQTHVPTPFGVLTACRAARLDAPVT